MPTRSLFSPEHDLFRDNVRKFFSRDLGPHLDRWEAAGHADRGFFTGAADAGLLCPQVAGDYGGAEADALFSAIVVEEAAFFSHLGLSLSVHSDLVAPTLERCGSESLKRQWLPRMAQGQAIGAWAADAAVPCEVVAERDGEQGYLLSGTARCVVNAALCDLVLVLARTGPAGGQRGLFLVDATAAGLRRTPVARPGLQSLDQGDLHFDQVRVPADHLLGAADAGLQAVAATQVWERLMVAVSAVSAAEAALAATVTYVRDRRAFGQTVMDFQNTRFVLADHKTSVAVARRFIDDCLAQQVSHSLEPVTAMQARGWCAELLGQVVDSCVQLHGGYGYMWEYPIARAYADARALRLTGRAAVEGAEAIVAGDPLMQPRPADQPTELPRSAGASRIELAVLPPATPGWWPAAWRGEREQAYHRFRARLQQFLEQQVLTRFPAWEAQSGFDHALFEDAGRAGLLCPTVPAEFGGAGLGREIAVAVIEMGCAYANLGLSLAMHSEIITSYLMRFGSDEVKRTWLPRMVRGEATGSLGMSEPSAGSDLKALRTTARRDGDHYVVSGSKIFNSGGGVADFVIVAAKTDPAAGAKGISLILVDTTLPGFRRGRRLHKVGLKSQDTAEVFFDDVRVPVSCLLGQENKGFGYMMVELPWERLQIAITSIGAVEPVLAWTIEQLRQTGVLADTGAVGQAARAKLALLLTEARIARSYYDESLRKLLDGTLDEMTSTLAKYWLSEWHIRSVDRCLELLGPDAYTSDNPVGRAYVDARAQRIYGGTSEIMKELISRAL